MAQISTVSGIEKLNTTLGAISGQIDNSQSLQATTLIGHGVMVPGTTILAGKGAEEGAVTSTTPFGVELQQPADKVTATITDKDGRVVRTLEIGELRAGVHTFTGMVSKRTEQRYRMVLTTLRLPPAMAGRNWWRSRCNSLWYRA